MPPLLRLAAVLGHALAHAAAPPAAAPPAARPQQLVVGCFDAADSTACVEAALAATPPPRSIVLPAQPTPYLIARPLFLRHSHQELVIRAGAVLEAKPGAFRQFESCLLSADGVSNYTIRGESPAYYPPLLRMRRGDYTNESAYPTNKTSEGGGPVGHRHVLAIGTRYNRTKPTAGVRVLDLTVSLAGGDGLYIQNATDVRLERVTASENFRQGMSVIDVDGLAVNHSVFRDTKGVPPAAGVDLEPDTPGERLSNIVFENCEFVGNAGAGFQVVPGNLNASSAPLSIRFTNHTVRSNFYGATVIYGSPTGGGHFAAGSHILLEDIDIDESVQVRTARFLWPFFSPLLR